jgi:Derlin-2/3
MLSETEICQKDDRFESLGPGTFAIPEMEMIQQIPPLTRYWAIGVVFCALLVTASVFTPAEIAFIPKFVFVDGEIWRLLFAPFFVGELHVQMVINTFLTFAFIARLENREYQGKLASFIVLASLVAFLVNLLSTAFSSYSVCDSMLTAMSYIYGKIYSTETILVMMVIPLPIQLFPFAEIILDIVSKVSLRGSLIGFFAGHAAFYLLFLLPVLMGREILKTPDILKRWCGEATG